MVADAHVHDAVECIYVNKGSLRIYINGTEERLSVGDFVVFHSLCIHSMYTEEYDENDYYVMKLSTKLLYDYSPGEIVGKFALKFTSYSPKLKNIWRKDEIEGTDIEYGLKRLIEEYERNTPLHDMTVILLGLLVLGGIYNGSFTDEDTSSGKSDFIFDSIVYINRYLDSDITEEGIAREFGVSPGHFSREFKRVTGKTFKEYLMNTRMDHAEHLIIGTDLQISEIAARCGYTNVSYFISLYKRRTGSTPHKIRKKAVQSEF